MEAFRSASVLIPTIDETAIEQVIARIALCCTPEEIGEFLIVYSPHSTKEYRQFLNAMPLRFPQHRVRSIPQEHQGLGGALFTGFQRAEGSHIITIAADLENDPDDVRKMIDLAKENPQCIITASRRLTDDGFGDYPKLKKLLNNGFHLFLHWFLHIRQTDPTYLFQCTPRRVFDDHTFSEHHEAFVLELALLPERRNIPLIEIPSVIRMRTSGKSHSSPRYYFHFLKYAIHTIWDR